VCSSSLPGSPVASRSFPKASMKTTAGDKARRRVIVAGLRLPVVLKHEKPRGAVDSPEGRGHNLRIGTIAFASGVSGLARSSHLAAAVLLLFIAFSARSDTAPSATPTTWHGADGQVLGSGTFAGLSPDGKKVRIQKPDHSTSDTAVDSLSLADRAFSLLNAIKDSEFQRPYRQWTSSNGNFHVDANALSADQQNAKLIRSDAKLLTVPLDRLSRGDRSYLDRLKQAISTTKDTDNPFQEIDSPSAAFNGQDSAAEQTKPAATVVRRADAAESKLPESAEDPTVYITKSGTKYHTAGCRYAKSGTPMPLSQAAARYSPCSVCSPPPLANESARRPQIQSSMSPSHRSRAAKPPTLPQSTGRNPNSENVSKRTATGIPTFTGPRGGQYHYSKSGKKVYEKKR